MENVTPVKKATSLRLDAELDAAAQHSAIDHHTTVQRMVEEGRGMQSKPCAVTMLGPVPRGSI
jgi:hypothetical protein